MISSMTGYGRGERFETVRKYIAEVRSENNRFLDISLRLPKNLMALEPKIRALVLDHVSRGRVTVTVISNGPEDEDQHLSLDVELAKSYYRILNDLKTVLNVPGDITLDVLSRLPNLISFDSPEQDVESEWRLIEPALLQAVDDCVAMRQAEGAQLQADMEKRLDLLEQCISEIEDLAPRGVMGAKERLEERLLQLTEIERIDPARLAVEAGLIAERCDVTEECVRFRSHNALFRETLLSRGAVGKRLGFLLQEMNREANTIGSKAIDARVSHVVVSLKEEIEKLREQVQNIE